MILKRHLIVPTVLFAGVISFSSCQKEILTEKNLTVEIPQAAVTNLVNDLPGRTLAANCFNCHGTNGFAGELKIASMGSSEILSKMNSYLTKDVRADIMYVHAQAYTTDEMKLIADFFSKQQ